MIIRLKAGLGNQLFQYAFGRTLEEKYNTEVKYDFSYFDGAKDFKIDMITDLRTHPIEASEQEISKSYLFRHDQKVHGFKYRFFVIAENILNKYYFLENGIKDKRNDHDMLDIIQHYKYLDGYFQNYKYYTGMKDILSSEFHIRNNDNPNLIAAIQEVQSCNSVAIGYRRGDQTTNKTTVDLFYGISPEYYKSSIEYCNHHIKSPVYYAFTNDIKCVKENMYPPKDLIFIGEKYHLNALEEFEVIRNCQNAIIPKSTFHWWGAWLQNDGAVIIRPKEWLINGHKWNVCSPEWIAIGN